LIALIPARRDSKRFPGKNRSSFNGTSLLELTLKAAMESGVVEEVYISSNDNLLLQDAETLGIKVPFVRDESLAQDETSSWEVVIDFVKRTRYRGDICLLQLTSPRREANDIKNLTEIYRKENSYHELTVVEKPTIEKLGTNFFCECTNQIYSFQHCASSVEVCPNGGVYIVKSDLVSLDSFRSLSGSHAFLVPIERSIDIDFKHQLESAEKEVRLEHG